MMAGARERRAGMALLEIVTALTIISVGLLGVVQMYQIGIDQIRQSQRKMVALRAIDNEIETLRALPAADRPLGDGLSWRSDTAPLELLGAAQATLDAAPYGPSPSLLEITVRLQWKEGFRTVSREVVTLLGAAP